MNKKFISLLFFTLFMSLSTLLFIHFGFLRKFQFRNEDLIIVTEPLIPYINSLTAHGENLMYYKTRIFYPDGTSGKFRRIRNYVKGVGEVFPKKGYTDRNGEILFYYKPPSQENMDFSYPLVVSVESGFKKSNLSQNKITLSPIPVILVHGYRDNEAAFDRISEYLEKRGIQSYKLNYASTEGILHSSDDLSSFIEKKRLELFNQGVKVNKFIIVSHSYGGLMSRYYSTSRYYIFNRNDIHKMIFLSVPHKGTPLASLFKNIFNDETINELSPFSSLFTEQFPTTINKGLNPKIQVGNLIVQYDEVVSAESSELDSWDIPTVMFHVGEDKRTIDTIKKGDFFSNSNHQLILQNEKVFEKIYEMLLKNLPYPSNIK